MNRIGYGLESYRHANYIIHAFLIFILFASFFFLTILPMDATSSAKVHTNITGNLTDPECRGCHTIQGKQLEPDLNQPNKPLIKETAPIIKINSYVPVGNYTAILAIGQTPYQLGPFYRDGSSGWSWWDTGVYGTEKQKNLVALMVLDKSTGTIKPVTGLTSTPTWPQASYRNHSGNYSYKADTSPSPITTQTNYSDQADIWMIKEVNLEGYSNANLTFWTWYSMETDWDYGYVAVSISGNIWTNLPGTFTTTTNPNGNNLGNGITGTTNGSWVQETMDLTPYAGNKILIGFRFKSDEAVNDEGWYIDDINVTSGINTIFNDNAETPVEIKALSVNVTYPQLTLLNLTDPLTNATILQYSQRTQQVNFQEDRSHPGTYLGYFKYDPFAEQYSGNYSVTLDTIINGSQVTANAQFQTTVFGCQSCHNKRDSGNETSFIHGESGYYGGDQSCMFMCHSGSRGFYRAPPPFNGSPFMGPPLSLNPMHVHEMQYGHSGVFLPGLYYQQPPYNIQSHVSTTTCSQCHTSFIHDNNGTDTANIANYTLYGTNISFSSGTHRNLTCENCHGNLTYPTIPQYQYQLQGSLGNYTPSFTSHESFTDTYIIAVDRTDNLTITIDGNNTTKSVELYSVGPVDNTTSALQGPCGGDPCDIIQSLAAPINMNITEPYIGTWIVKLIQLEEGTINYTISSNYPIQKKPIIQIPECNVCHNSIAVGKAFTNDNIPDWNPGYAHVDINKDGKFDVQCRMCHDAMHDITIKDCQTCHTTAPTNHPITEPTFSQYAQSQCLGCHGSPHNVSAGGGADCVSCHDTGGGGAPLDKRINVSSIRQGVHSNLNNGTDNTTALTDPVDKACWACHGDGTEPSNGHPGNFKTPYSCENCHNRTTNLTYTNSSLIPNLTTRKVFNHVPNPDVQSASSIVNNSSADCRGCHDKSKINYSDSGLSVAANVSHYASRTNLVSPTINCSLCHKNPANATTYWANVTRHPARSQDISFCDNCHYTSFLSEDFHSSAPLKAKRVHNDFDWQDGLCSTPCHGGTPLKVCEDCHLANGSGPYLQNGANGTRLNDSIPRVYAHTNFSTSINVPNQSNIYPPSTGAQTFSSCYSFNSTTLAGTCHGNSYTNSSISGGYFALNSSLGYTRGSAYHEAITIDRLPKTTNCVFCHSQTDITIRAAWGNAKQITGGTHDWYTGSDNNRCWNCHVSTGTAPKDFHSDSLKGGGGTECMICHDKATGPADNPTKYPAIVNTSFRRHQNVNTTNGTDILDSNDCRTCHYNTTNMSNVLTYRCEDCHTQGNYSAPVIQNHRPPHNPAVNPGAGVTTRAYCSACHNNSVNTYAYSANASVSHYGTNTSLIKPTVNQTSMPRFGFMTQADASAYNSECNNCHNPSNPDYGNATLITVAHISRGTCNECHVNVSASDMHNGSIGIPQTFGCKDCHTIYAARYRASNLTGTNMALFSATSCEGCHGGGNNNGLLDTLGEHNTNRNYTSGKPGRTDIVYLNNQTALTITKGTPVMVKSRVNDTAGDASRVGGAEYYIDIDPGVGKGTPMDAADGQYNAANRNWENVTGTIDTSNLSEGTHIIYVRGMDIGKQWSSTQSATLIIQSLGYINGTVTYSGSPVAGAVINATGAITTSGIDGTYSLRVPVGTYNITASKQPEYYDSTATGIVVAQDNTTIQNFMLSLKPTGTIAGTVHTQ